MEILNIRIYSKDDSLIELYPCPEGCIDFDIDSYQRFLLWAIEHADASGSVQLMASEYDTVIELSQWDDLPCPLSFVIEYEDGNNLFRLGLSYSRTSYSARIIKAND